MIPLNNNSIGSLIETNYNNYFTNFASNNSIEYFHNNNNNNNIPLNNLSNLSPNFVNSQNYIIPNSYNYQSNQYHQSFLHSNTFSYYLPTINTNIYDELSRINATELSTINTSIESITPVSLKKTISNYKNVQDQKNFFSTSINNDLISTTSISITNRNDSSLRYFNNYNLFPTNLQKNNYLLNEV